jgi:hypothetical protein
MGRKEVCEKCNWDARVCKNCRFYDRNAYRECKEPQAEFVNDKEKNNFCSYFSANDQAPAGQSDADKAKQKLDSLFGGSETKSDESSPLSSLAEEFDKFTSKK